MNLLIIGGLLALGLLAIVGAVFLAMGEKRAAAPKTFSQQLEDAGARR